MGVHGKSRFDVWGKEEGLRDVKGRKGGKGGKVGRWEGGKVGRWGFCTGSIQQERFKSKYIYI